MEDVYVVGWARRASDGVVGRARLDAETGIKYVLSRLARTRPGRARRRRRVDGAVVDTLKARGVAAVPYTEVARIEAVERERAKEPASRSSSSPATARCSRSCAARPRSGRGPRRRGAGRREPEEQHRPREPVGARRLAAAAPVPGAPRPEERAARQRRVDDADQRGEARHRRTIAAAARRAALDDRHEHRAPEQRGHDEAVAEDEEAVQAVGASPARSRGGLAHAGQEHAALDEHERAPPRA